MDCQLWEAFAIEVMNKTMNKLIEINEEMQLFLLSKNI